MENRNEPVKELDPEQMAKVSGGLREEIGLSPRTCALCGAVFDSLEDYDKHCIIKHGGIPD